MHKSIFGKPSIPPTVPETKGNQVSKKTKKALDAKSHPHKQRVHFIMLSASKVCTLYVLVVVEIEFSPATASPPRTRSSHTLSRLRARLSFLAMMPACHGRPACVRVCVCVHVCVWRSKRRSVWACERLCTVTVEVCFKLPVDLPVDSQTSSEWEKRSFRRCGQSVVTSGQSVVSQWSVVSGWWKSVRVWSTSSLTHSCKDRDHLKALWPFAHLPFHYYKLFKLHFIT